MISIIEQGFFRRNWGKLALGGGLAYAASQGDAMPLPKPTADTPIPKPTADTPIPKPNVPSVAPKVNLQQLDKATQNAAERSGAVTRSTVDYGKKTAQSFKRGYEGRPNVPAIKPPPIKPPPNTGVIGL
jgi:hypothetical protein